MSQRPVLAAVMGPTASGKSDLAEAIADDLDAVLVNADAFQVYRGLDIGTGKSPRSGEYELIDLVDPAEQFGVGQWVALAQEVLEQAFRNGRHVVVVGGTGLYIRALFEEYQTMVGPPDPEIRRQVTAWYETEGLEAIVERVRAIDLSALDGVDCRNPARVRRVLERKLAPTSAKVNIRLPNFCKVKMGIRMSVEDTEARIVVRVHQMTHRGWVAEVSDLLARGVPVDAPGMRAIGYPCLSQYINGEISLDQAIEEVICETRRYAKRQRTWLRSEPGLHWLESVGTESLREQALQWLKVNCLEE